MYNAARRFPPRPVGKALGRCRAAATKVTVVVPDASVRVLRLDSTAWPARRGRAAILRFAAAQAGCTSTWTTAAALALPGMRRRDGHTLVRTVGSGAVMPAACAPNRRCGYARRGMRRARCCRASLASAGRRYPGEEPALRVKNRQCQLLHYDGERAWGRNCCCCSHYGVWARADELQRPLGAAAAEPGQQTRSAVRWRLRGTRA